MESNIIPNTTNSIKLDKNQSKNIDPIIFQIIDWSQFHEGEKSVFSNSRLLQLQFSRNLKIRIFL